MSYINTSFFVTNECFIVLSQINFACVWQLPLLLLLLLVLKLFTLLLFIIGCCLFVLGKTLVVVVVTAIGCTDISNEPNEFPISSRVMYCKSS